MADVTEGVMNATEVLKEEFATMMSEIDVADDEKLTGVLDEIERAIKSVEAAVAAANDILDKEYGG